MGMEERGSITWHTPNQQAPHPIQTEGTKQRSVTAQTAHPLHEPSCSQNVNVADLDLTCLQIVK